MAHILITGANRGIGLTLVVQCAERGDKIFAACRSPKKAVNLKALANKYTPRITIVGLDVTDEESIDSAASMVSRQVQALDVLINNAGTHYEDVRLSEVQTEILLKTLHVNAVGPLTVAQRFRNLLLNSGNPKIVNISSEAGSISKMNRFRGYAYYGSKAAENMLTRCLAYDPEIKGITVIAMHPGWVRTDMGGPNAPLSTAESAAGILKVTDQLTPEDNGNFYTWEGVKHPW
jgi:NAD(P)-dependent dehydrogenase (short-subunit alcohol dehydrogenase family)